MIKKNPFLRFSTGRRFSGSFRLFLLKELNTWYSSTINGISKASRLKSSTDTKIFKQNSFLAKDSIENLKINYRITS